jgi:opacity protein-like surface antigen
MIFMHIAFIVVVALIMAVTPGYGHAADFEIIPFVGYTWGGDFKDETTGTKLGVDETSNYGIMLDINQSNDSQIELYYSHQSTRLHTESNGFYTGTPLFDLNINYIHIGGTYGMDSGKLKPFVVGTLGVTYMDPKGEGLDSATKFSLGLGGGVKIFLTDHLGMRFEGRWFGTLFDGSGEAFCASSGQCLIKVRGDVFSQFVANAGLVFAF